MQFLSSLIHTYLTKQDNALENCEQNLGTASASPRVGWVASQRSA